MADPDPRLLSALTTEHFVLQSAINATVSLIDTALEAQQYMAGIARVHNHYRTLSPEAAQAFAVAFYAFERWRFDHMKPRLGQFMPVKGRG